MYFNVNKYNNVPVLTNSFGTDDVARINILKSKAKMNIEMPLFYENEGVINKIGPVSLVHSQYINTDCILGHGIGINLINRIDTVFTGENGLVETVVLQNNKYEDVYYNITNELSVLDTEENNTYMVVDYLTNNNTIIRWDTIRLYDLNGNYFIYEYQNGNYIYPSYYHRTSLKSDEDIEIYGDDNEITFTFSNQEIFISRLNNVCTFKIDGETISSIDLTYENGYLKSITKYLHYRGENNTIIKKDVVNKEYVFNNNEYIKVKNLINGFYTKYELDGNKRVTKYTNCFEANEDSGKATTISYDSETETRISNYRGQITKYYFDNGKLISCIDPFNKVMTINYDSENNIVEKLNMLDISDVESAKRGNMINTEELYDEGTDKVILYNNYGSTYSSKIVTLDNVDIIKNSGLTFIINCKKIYSVEEKLKIKIKLINTTNNEYEEHIAYSSLVRSRLLPVSKMFISNNNYNKVEITIENRGSNNKYEISNIQLYNHLYGSITHYNEYGKVSKTYNGENVIKRSYIKEDKTLLLTSSGSDKNASIYNYDAKGNIIEVINVNGTKVLYEYDAFNNLIKETLINDDNSYFEKSYTYTEDGTKVLSETNEDGLVINYEYVRNNRLLSKITHNNGLVEDFTYNNSFDITKHKINKSITDSVDIDYLYDSFRRVYEIKLDNNYSYKFYYDDFGNITNTYIKKNDLLYTIDALEYEYKNEVYTENIESHKVGNTPNGNNIHFYEYDDKNNLKKIYLNSISDPNLLYEFIYDVNNNLVTIIDSKNNETINFTYDNYGNLVSDEKLANGLAVKTNYKYDLKKNMLFEEHKINNQTIDLYSYSVGRKEIKSPIHLYNYYKNYDKDLYSCFLLTKSNTGSYRYSLSNSNRIFDLTNPNQNIITTTMGNCQLQTFDYTSSTNFNLNYRLKENNTINNRTIICWFRPLVNLDKTNRIVLSMCDHNQPSNSISLYINKDKNIQSSELGFISSETVNMGAWNYIALSIENNNTYLTYEININGNIYSNSVNKVFNWSDQRVCFGNDVNSTESEYRFYGYMTCLFVSTRKLNSSEVNDIYKDTSEYFIYYNSVYPNDVYDTDLITTRYLHMTSPLVPLCKSFESINDEINYHFSESSTYNRERDELFIYDKEYLKDYGYKVNGNDLSYENNFTGSFAMSFNSIFQNISSETLNSFIIELRNKTETNDDLILSLFRQDDGLLCVKLYGLDLETNLFANNGLNKYYISLYLSDRDGVTGEYVYRLIVKLNNDQNIYTYYYRTYNEINFNRIVLDKKDDNTYTYDSIINMLYIANNSSSLNQMSNLSKTEKHITTVDNLSRLYKEELYNDNNRVLTKNINYKNSIENDKNKCYNIIKTEEFYTSTFAMPERSIGYIVSDSTGNITKRTYECPEDIIDESEYIYDKLGWLVEEKNISNNICTRYTYDDLGNIINIKKTNASNSTNISETNFVYNQIPIRLNSFSKDGIVSTVNYSSSNFLLPISIVNSNNTKLFSWDGTNLSGYQLISGENILRDLNFEYDQQGRRIKKISVDNISLETITRSYRYSQNKLIEEYVIDELNSDEYKLHYLYDESGMLYGFEYGTNTYYYLRDSLQTIIGIIDVNGNIVCEYKYDAYGNHKVYNSNNVEMTSKNFIGNINPFRYKGYYYDVETNLFLVSSRYYSPELCRWISPDDIEYLDPESVNGLNLYCYCLNNPIMYVDPDGHFPITALLIGIGIGLFAGAVTSGISSALDGNTGWELIGDIVAGGIIGAALGAATALGGLVGIGAIAGKTAIASFAISTVASFGAGVGSYAIDKWTSNEQINVKEMLMYGGATALQSVFNFGIGMVYGASGNWDTLNQGVFGNFKREMKEAGYGMVKRFAGASAMYLKTAYKDILKRMIIRSVFNKSYDLLESLIY